MKLEQKRMNDGDIFYNKHNKIKEIKMNKTFTSLPGSKTIGNYIVGTSFIL